jgi:hypothetical protein
MAIRCHRPREGSDLGDGESDQESYCGYACEAIGGASDTTAPTNPLLGLNGLRNPQLKDQRFS